MPAIPAADRASSSESYATVLCACLGAVLLLVALVIEPGGDPEGLSVGTAIFGIGLLIAAALSARDGTSQLSAVARRSQLLQYRLDAANARISKLRGENRRLHRVLSRLLGRPEL